MNKEYVWSRSALWVGDLLTTIIRLFVFLLLFVRSCLSSFSLPAPSFFVSAASLFSIIVYRDTKRYASILWLVHGALAQSWLVRCMRT